MRADTPPPMREEYLVLDTIGYDAAVYEKFKTDRFYDYHEVRVDKKSLKNQLYEDLYRWFTRNFNKNIDRKDFDAFMWIIGIIVFIIILVIIYLANPSLFYLNKKNKLLYSVEEEDIHGSDFNQLIKEALYRKEYPEAIRWVYIKTLKALHEKEYISWEANKTVNEYVFEIKNLKLRKDFRELSEDFVYYRYGNGEANEKRFRNFESLSEQVIKQTQ
jgi:hypothetical protein